ncbi:cysteine--1-D-myo-inosityl 2-amino-2-deoxy-alpha-D-glucopyranoside ligase [Corynebacterium sp. TAE3-ERU30]|uniref:cysteine--1-D-myo-inosityl 2-amino-2-deoxy-alpha-D-glucopyranoside ligase n=1 Tax=Corynebacterium sp. TAE3-ERU30 TaxID=2849496 RepID=UPI001C450DA0|nr:cysteine--1-D-myo-inosityl 2-amino-2-deoxy-alpha-D-glucopyranoside ligase [Corynebacterium sp. TAE3-ERU30]MBV7280883.1 cysteine--1-D-myo-inosityl 2-amino-2-deoxy-alpha-D-glucopyranoside ligase [Corynebacterium sp. TAE3-ERU30]
MHSWPQPDVPALSGDCVELQLYDTADQCVRPVHPAATAGMYVCGITPYDSTHLGHAATYVAFDLIYRQLLDNGHEVVYVQNVTDVDDPLFERAARDNVDWRELGDDQTTLFRSDMTALKVIPPRDFVSVSEAVGEVITVVQQLLDKGAAYVVDDPEYPDIYAPIDATEHFGYISGYTAEQMRDVFADRGGDPDRPGKRHPLDALIWRAAREGEPSWDAPFGAGRPGWHIECSAIANNRLQDIFDIQGGGSDLAFPHHEFSAAHYESLTDSQRMAGHYVHAGMIALDGVKMSKSLGNLVFVHKLTAAGHEPAAIRLGIYSSHYRGDRDWSDAVLARAEERLAAYRAAMAATTDEAAAQHLVQQLRERLAADLDTPGALEAADAWAAAQDTEGTEAASRQEQLSAAGEYVRTAFDALLGVEL